MDDVELRVQLERVHADCFGWAMSCCGRNRDDAEEVLQTVYLAVLDGRARYDARSSFRTWLFGVIRRARPRRKRQKAWLRGLLVAVKREAGRGKRGSSPRILLWRRTRWSRTNRGETDCTTHLAGSQRGSVRCFSSCSTMT